MKALTWARVSTRSQQEEGYSIEAQIKSMREFATKHELNIVKHFEVPESASGRQERKEFNQMLEYLNTHSDIKVLITEKVDRITRNFRDAVTLDEWLNKDEERKIYFVKQSLIIHKNARSHEKFQWDIYLAMARQYSNNLSEEVRKGLSEKASQGWYPGSRKRGYKAIGDDGHKIWILDESEASELNFVKRAFELYDTGEFTTKTLGPHLYKEGWKSSAGTPIGKSEMHRMLSDCFYCGEFEYKGVHHKNGHHPAIISKELFYRVQERLYRKNIGKYRKHEFLFQNLIKCGECGMSVVAEVQKGHNYYHCTKHKASCTQRKYIREEVIESQLLEVFGNFVYKPKLAAWILKALKESHQAEKDYHDTSLTELNRQYLMIKKRLDGIYEDKLDGTISKEMYLKKFEQYNQELEAINDSINSHKAANIDYMQLGSVIFELSQKAKEIYQIKEKATEKRSLLNVIFSNLNLIDGKIIPVYKNAFQLIAERSLSNTVLALVDDFRTANWMELVKYPQLTLNQATELLATV